MGRPVRFLAKQEIFDAPVVGQLARALGGIPVDRGSRSGEPMRAAAASLRAGEAVIVLPQGTIPRGGAFFDPVLKGRTGTARLATETGAPVVPVGLFGTEQVWPRSAKLPDMTTLLHPRQVSVVVGQEVELGHTDAVADTEVLMAAIADLLPPEAHTGRAPTPDELGAHPTLGVTVRAERAESALPARAALAAAAVRTGNRLSRLLARGSGTVVGGRAGLFVDPHLLENLARGRAVALVTGTNGKTTVTRMLVAALEGASCGAVATNATGANMPAGHVAALVASPRAQIAVLEVDESYLGQLVEGGAPEVVVLLNLSRDQLDRIAEVRMLVERWRTALGASGPDERGQGPVVVANADDPMVAWAAQAAHRVRWVGAGQVWHDDAVGCPACGGQIDFGDGGKWACERCDFARPEPVAWLEGDELVLADGARRRLDLGLPGQFNRANAADGRHCRHLDARAAVDR